MPNYMFDMSLFASIHIEARSRSQARRRLEKVLRRIEFTYNLGSRADLGLTDVVISPDDGVPGLFDIDGDPAE